MIRTQLKSTTHWIQTILLYQQKQKQITPGVNLSKILLQPTKLNSQFVPSTYEWCFVQSQHSRYCQNSKEQSQLIDWCKKKHQSKKEAEETLLQSIGTACFHFSTILASPYSYGLPFHSILQQRNFSLEFKSFELVCVWFHSGNR